MSRTTKRSVIGLMILILSVVVWHISAAQLEGLEGMEAPEDVEGMDCTMCHGEFALAFEYLHQPAADGECTLCHLETGEGGHGGLVADGRDLCLACHADRTGHYPVMNCWAASCHADMHGSDVDELFNPSRQESYPGFEESTACATYVGSDTCLGCHCDKSDWWIENIHSLSDCDDDTPLDRQGCESCHGPGSEHMGRRAGIGIFPEASVEESDTRCFKCHKDEMFESDYWKSVHPLSGVACTSCHDLHSNEFKHSLAQEPNELCFSCHKTKRADFSKLSRHPVNLSDPRTGMLCTECHNPHGAEGAMMLNEPADELCASCHVDKAGPFVYSHPGYDPTMSDGCSLCHSHHGSNSPNLLKLNGRAACMQCHSDQATHMTGRSCWTSGCHTEHHGSNSNYFFFN